MRRSSPPGNPRANSQLSTYDRVSGTHRFGARLRDQVDLDTLTADLLAVVDQTMQPTQASLWLRPQAPSGTAGATVAQQRT
jgi:hypothetical protein